MKIQGKGFQEGLGTPYHVVVSSSAVYFRASSHDGLTFVHLILEV